MSIIGHQRPAARIFLGGRGKRCLRDRHGTCIPPTRLKIGCVAPGALPGHESIASFKGAERSRVHEKWPGGVAGQAHPANLRMKEEIMIGRINSDKMVILVMAIVAFTVAACASPRTTTLAAGGKSDYTIVIGPSCSPSERYAAQELQLFLEQISGSKLPVSTRPAAGAMILVCRSAAPDAMPVKPVNIRRPCPLKSVEYTARPMHPAPRADQPPCHTGPAPNSPRTSTLHSAMPVSAEGRRGLKMTATR